MTLFRAPEVRTTSACNLVRIWVRTTDRRYPLRSVWIAQPAQPSSSGTDAAMAEGGVRCA